VHGLDSSRLDEDKSTPIPRIATRKLASRRKTGRKPPTVIRVLHDGISQRDMSRDHRKCTTVGRWLETAGSVPVKSWAGIRVPALDLPTELFRAWLFHGHRHAERPAHRIRD
jgi:hypothetical protein